MKIRFLTIIFFLGGILISNAQVGINKDGSVPNSSAMLDVKSSNQGFLLPRLSDSEKDLIAAPAEGLLIFNTTSKTLNLYKDGKWYEFTGLSCIPQPSVADAGVDQTVVPYSLFLNATVPVKGTGAWSVQSGIGGTIIAPSIATSQFTGQAGTVYVLRWTVSTVCSSNYDDMILNFYPDCNNNAREGTETDIDCGGGYCPVCSYGKHCLATSDCQGYPNAATACISTICSFTCNAGYGNCDNNAANGCETNVMNNVSNCGTCGNVCALPNATATCTAGSCVIASCNPGFGDCDGIRPNGCETNLMNNASNCGICGNVCSFPNATGACTAGSCLIASCNAGFGNCDGNMLNGCETNLMNNVSNCGTCGNICSLPNAAAACTAGSCVIASCNAGFGNCDFDNSNGCETNLMANVSNCGTCGFACPLVTNGSPTCTNGTCSFVCNTGFHPSGGQCVPN